MSELKAKNKELEKFKFVLDYKLRELAKEIEPRDEQIMQMRETIRELDDELQRDYKTSVGMEHGLSEKEAKINSLQEECKATRRAVLEKERVINFFGRDVQRLVNTTDPQQLKEGIRGLYRSIVRGAAEVSKEDEAVQAEFTHQREYMERALEALKTRIGRTEGQTKADFQRKIAENEQLITECNTLRKETVQLRAQLSKAQNELQNGGRSSSGALAGRRTQTSSQGLLRPGSGSESAASVMMTKSSLAAAASTPTFKGGSPAGQLLKGPAGAMGRERARTAEVLMSLEASQREQQMQRAEILRLREQVAMLAGEGDAAGAGERPASQQDRPHKYSPMPQQPRAASAID